MALSAHRGRCLTERAQAPGVVVDLGVVRAEPSQEFALVQGFHPHVVEPRVAMFHHCDQVGDGPRPKLFMKCRRILPVPCGREVTLSLSLEGQSNTGPKHSKGRTTQTYLLDPELPKERLRAALSYIPCSKQQLLEEKLQ